MNNDAKVLDCEFQFKCPQKWDAMDNTGNDDIHFCRQCSKFVYFAGTKERLEELKRAGQCVAVLQNNPQVSQPPIMLAGMVVPPSSFEQVNTRETICPGCGKKAPSGARFCGHCGRIIN